MFGFNAFAERAFGEAATGAAAKLTATAAATATVTASFPGTSAQLSASASAVAAASGTLSTGIALAAAVIAQAAASATFVGQGAALSASAAARASASGALSTSISLTAAALAAASCQASLTAQIALTAIAQAQASAAAEFAPIALPTWRVYVVDGWPAAGSAVPESYQPDQYGKPTISASPSATLDYWFDWTKWLADSSDTIKSINIICVGCSVVRSSFVDGLVVAWVGNGEAYMPASITCEITTNGGRTDDRTVYLKMVPR